MTIREKVLSDLNLLDEVQLRQISDYLDFLKLRKEKKLKGQNGNSTIDSVYNLGKHPVKTEIKDASENLDEYLY